MKHWIKCLTGPLHSDEEFKLKKISLLMIEDLEVVDDLNF